MIAIKNKHSDFRIYLLGLLILLFLIYAFNIPIPTALLSLLMITVMCLGNQDEILAISMCCIPLHSTVDFYLVMGVSVILYTLKYYRQIKVGIFVLFILFLVLWEFLHCFDTRFDLKTTIGTLMVMILLAVVVSSDLRNMDYPFIVRVVAIASLNVCFVCIVNHVVAANFNLSAALNAMQRLGMMYDKGLTAKGSLNSNTLGIINLLSISALLQLRLINQHRKSDNLIMFMLLVFGLLTASRTFIACLLLVIVLYIMGQSGGWQKKFRIAISMVFLAVAVFLVYLCVFPDSFAFFISRFLEGSFWGGRDTIMADYNSYLINNPFVMFFGVGLSKFAEKVIIVYEMSSAVPHNGIQEILVAWGAIGLIIFVAMLITMLQAAKYQNRKQSIVNYIPLILILIKSMAGQLLTSSYTMLALIFAYLSLCQDFSVPQKNKELSL